MTCIEYLKQIRPGYVEKRSANTIMLCTCPSDYMNIPDPESCWRNSESSMFITCKQCWEREFRGGFE